MVVKELVALLGIKTDKKSQAQAEGGMNKLIGLAKAAAVAFAGLKIVQFLKGTVQAVANLGDRFDKLAKRTGLATAELQGLEHAAELSGASLGDIETAIKRLQAGQVEAADGVAEYADEFKRMGIEIKDAEGNLKPTTDLLVEMADGIQGLETDAEKTAVAVKLLGRGGMTLIPMLKEGSGALREMMEEMEALGGVMDKDLVQASADYIDNQRRIDVAVRGVKNAIGKALLPQINALTTSFIKWWKVNGQIIRQRVGEFLGRVGRVVAANVKFFGRLVRGVFNLLVKLSPLQKKILGVTAAITAIGLAIRAGPIGKFLLLATVIAALIEDFQVWSEGGRSAIGAVMNKIGELLGIDMSFEQWSQDMRIFAESTSSIFDGMLAGMFASFEDWDRVVGGMWSDQEKDVRKSVEAQARIWNELLPSISQAFDQLFGIDIPSNYVDFVRATFELGQKIKTWFDGLLGSISGAVVGTIEGFGESVWNFLLGLGKRIGDWVKGAIDAITAPFKAAADWIEKLTAGKPKPVVVPLSATPTLRGAATLTGAPRAAPGGAFGAPARARAAAGGTSIVNAPRTSIEVEVHGAPGMNVNQLANEVGKQIDKKIQKQNRDAIRALTPTPAGPV